MYQNYLVSITTSFKVYNASAGSGKTFTLVKAYLKLLLQSKHSDSFRNILALTFTNKAVGEMKTRIIETLKQFSDEAILTEPNSIFISIVNELEANPKNIHIASKNILQNILHNYAAFDISTIDRFTHKVIRTFAFDLKIPLNFEVELDTDSLLTEAVDSLISKAGTDKALTKVLVDFAIEKADDDKSWDISYDFNKISKLLVNENDAPFLEFFKNKTLKDFKQLKLILNSKMAICGKTIVEKAQVSLKLIEECGLQFDDFTRSSLPKHFESLANNRLDIKFDNNWQIDIENTLLYPSRVSPDIASIIEDIKPQLIIAFLETKQLAFEYKFYKNFYRNLTPLSVLNAINSELIKIKDDSNVLLISEFNNIIHKEIKNQPTPFIYERLGEKFKHYFIDEFQDTSKMQWENLIPLIDNRISSEAGSAMLVGDAKQAIYRWRGGRAEIFMELFNKATRPFIIEQEVIPLKFNYRSCKSIVKFNNAFFSHLSSFAFADDTHKDLYLLAAQKEHIETDGYVNIEFLQFEEGDDRDILYPEAVKQIINQSIANGFQLSDICVLVRKKKEGVVIADYLSQYNIDIISSETLLINGSPKVRFVTNLLKLSTQPENNELKADVLYFISDLLGIKEKHTFLQEGLVKTFDELRELFAIHELDFNFNTVLQLSLYDAVEYIVRAFALVKTSNAYVQFYLDTVLDYSQKQSSSIIDFLAYWEKKKDLLSITIPDGGNAVQIMTIHKSKGLEFPVVIFPYADLNIYREKEPKIWFPINGDEFNGFSHALLNYNKDLAELGDVGNYLHNKHQSSLELDNINLLYVTLTRAIEQLHIISKKDLDSKGNEKLNDYSGLFINHLKTIGVWSDTKNVYAFGKPKKQMIHVKHKRSVLTPSRFISNNNSINIVTTSGNLWGTEQEQAIEKGNLIHYLLSKIQTAADIDFVLNDALTEGLIDNDQKNQLNATIHTIVNHSQLQIYYTDDVLIYNERDIISSNGTIVRPDRLVINKSEQAILIDYKTGTFNKKHEQQLITYADIIHSMKIPVIKKILVYINNDIDIKEI